MTQDIQADTNDLGDTSESSSCCAPKSEEATSCCDSTPTKESTFNINDFLKKLWSPWSAIVVIPLLVGFFDNAQFAEFFNISSSAFMGTLPFIVFAVLLIAYLKATGAETVVARIFEGRENRMIVFAALFGGLAPFCSCEVIPFIAGLLAIGTPLPAVMAFWLSSPLIDPASLVITAGALGWPFAVGKAVAAVSLGLFGGFTLKLLARGSVFSSPLKNAPVTSCCSSPQPATSQTVWKFWQQPERVDVFKEQTKENLVFLIKWLMFAYVLEALLILYIPAQAIATVVGGDGFFSVIIGAAVGMPAYLNGYAAPALVAGLVEQGMSIGAAMAFMTAGAISSIPAMTAVWSLVKKPVFFTYLGFGFVGSVLFGWLFGLVL
jgi:uncharacterized membrane protein YraQ (UPF0718 family)